MAVNMSNWQQPTRPYRVVQWATGNIGTRALKAVIEHPNMTLAGLYVYADAKAGRDAGELCGLRPAGVKATRNIEDIVALGADCVLYMPQSCNFDEVCRLLASGANIVTTRGEFLNPARLDPALRQRVEEACHTGGTSIHSTGSSPGFITEAVPLVLTSIQRRLDSLRINEYADLSQRDSPDMLFNVMGFGRPPPKSDEGRLYYLREAFGPSLELVASALSIPIDSVEASGATATVRRTTKIAAGVLEAGTMAAQRTTVSAMSKERAVLSFTATWYCTADLNESWDLRPTGWHIAVDGDTPLDVDLRMPIPLERMAAVSPGYTAHRAVNAVPFVCAASPGIRSSVELPQIIADLSSR
jgi:4-hydroxy-tetrahydrodipicolinate reductase